MPKSCCWIQINAAFTQAIVPIGVAKLPQLFDRRNTKFGPDLVETDYLARHRLVLDFYLRGYCSEG